MHSYKFIIDSDEYAGTGKTVRTPAWCDRVLYCGSDISVMCYTSVPTVRGSDHREPPRGEGKGVFYFSSPLFVSLSLADNQGKYFLSFFFSFFFFLFFLVLFLWLIL